MPEPLLSQFAMSFFNNNSGNYRPRRQLGHREFDIYTVFVANIPYSANEEDLRSCFQEYGEIKQVRLIKSRDSNFPHKGYAFVEFTDDMSVALILSANPIIHLPDSGEETPRDLERRIDELRQINVDDIESLRSSLVVVGKQRKLVIKQAFQRKQRFENRNNSNNNYNNHPRHQDNGKPEGKDYYEMIGLEFGASIDEIKTKRRMILNLWHSDKCKGYEDFATCKFQQYQQIFEVLENPETKQIYDREGEYGLEEGIRPAEIDVENIINIDYECTEADLNECKEFRCIILTVDLFEKQPKEIVIVPTIFDKNETIEKSECGNLPAGDKRRGDVHIHVVVKEDK